MMTHDSDPFDEPGLADRYLAGEASAGERARVERWQDAAAERKTLLETMCAGLATVTGNVPHRATDEALQSVLDRALVTTGDTFGGMTPQMGVRSLRPRTRTFRQSIWTQWGIPVLAASLIVVIVMGGWLRSRSSAPMRTYATSMGERLTVRLADGSSVTLAPQTTLTVESDFGSSARHVSLVGNAYFDVRPTPHVPFVVRTGTVTTRVLGTTFNVTHYAQDSHVQIAVASGRVETWSPHQAAVILDAGMVGQAGDSAIVATSVGDVSAYTDWTHGRLEFHDTRLPEVLATLERWYGVRFHVADPWLDSVRIDARLDFHTTADMIAALNAMLGVSATFEPSGDTIIVVLRARRSSVPTIVPHRNSHDQFHTTTEIGR